MASWKSNLPASAKLRSTPREGFLLGLTTFLVFLSGCRLVGPEFVQPDVPTLSQQYQAKQFQHQPSIGLDSWWHSFADPILEQLVSQALQNNLTVQVAAERIIEARANVSLNGGNLAPNVVSSTGYEYLKRSPNARPFVGQNGNPFQLFTSGLDSIWEIDLFGRLERAIQASEAELVAQEYSLQDVQQTLVADVGSSYLNIRLLQNQIQTIDQSLMLQEETNRIVSARADAGVGTKLDAEQTQAFLHRSRADKAILELQLNCEFNRLSILLGESPAPMIREFVGIGPIPDAPYVPESGIPADLIRRRPDIRQAEAEVGAATALVGVAEADLYPTLTLLGSISLSAQDVSSLFQTDSLAFNVGPSFSWNILHFGRICDNIEIHESRLRQTAISYRSVVLNAVKEVEDAMVKYDGFQKQLVSLENALRSDAIAVELSLQRYRIGKANFQRVLDSQLQLLQDSQASAAARANANIQLVRLYRAIGGGWPGHRGVPGHAGGQTSGGCAGCVAAGQADVGLTDSQVLQHEIVGDGIVTQDPNGVVVQEQPNYFTGDIGSTISEVPQGVVGAPHETQMPGQTHMLREGKTILRLEDTLPSTSASPPSDFSPIEITPDLGQSQPQDVGPVVNHGMSKELFDWDEQDKAVVRSMRQSQRPVQPVANTNYSVESPEQSNMQSTQKASLNQFDATEWTSEIWNDN